MSTISRVSVDENAETVIDDGELLAIRQRGRVEVWCDEGKSHMGNLPADATESAIHNAANFWVNGFTAGTSQGALDALSKLRTALGLER